GPRQHRLQHHGVFLLSGSCTADGHRLVDDGGVLTGEQSAAAGGMAAQEGRAVFSERAFFSFVELDSEHEAQAYNEWHRFDHLPENLALPGVAWGDRWARTAECGTVPGHHAVPEYSGIDYVAMYWFHPPYDESIQAWTELGEDTFQCGRGPRLPGVRRRLTAFFTPVKGYVAPRVPISVGALPMRPNR